MSWLEGPGSASEIFQASHVCVSHGAEPFTAGVMIYRSAPLQSLFCDEADAPDPS